MRPNSLVVLALASLAACNSTADRTGQSTQGFYAPSFESLWDVGEESLRATHLFVDSEESSRDTRTMVTRWETHLSQMSMRGYRDQATLYFHPVEGRDNYWTVEANVVRQRNKNLKEPSNPIRVDWDTGARVVDTERLLVSRIQTFFVEHDVSPEFRSRYNMAPGRSVIPAPASMNPETSDPNTAR